MCSILGDLKRVLFGSVMTEKNLHRGGRVYLSVAKCVSDYLVEKRDMRVIPRQGQTHSMLEKLSAVGIAVKRRSHGGM